MGSWKLLLHSHCTCRGLYQFVSNCFKGISSWKSLLIITGSHQFVPIRNGFLEIITSQSLYMQVPTNLYQIVSKASVLGNHCLITGMYSTYMQVPTNLLQDMVLGNHQSPDVYQGMQFNSSVANKPCKFLRSPPVSQLDERTHRTYVRPSGRGGT